MLCTPRRDSAAIYLYSRIIDSDRTGNKFNNIFSKSENSPLSFISFLRSVNPTKWFLSIKIDINSQYGDASTKQVKTKDWFISSC